jgi:ABC-type transporter MlaC component
MKKMSALFALLVVATLSANANMAEQKPAKTEQKTAKAEQKTAKAEQKTEAKAPAAKANMAAPAATTQK